LEQKGKKPKWIFEPLDANKHNRAAFSCGQEPLDRYLQQRANQDLQKRVAAVMVLTPDGTTIAGYYTLSQYAIDLSALPEETVKKLRLPKYSELPATLLGRLARSSQFRGQGVGELLLMEALRRSLQQSQAVASMAVVVDAKDGDAKAFYLKYGFIELPDHPDRLFLPMATIQEMFP
jgi:predicted GNAT family N-acyltransferase